MAAWVLSYSSSFQQCYAAAYQDDRKQEQQSSIPGIPDRVWHFAECAAFSLNENNGAVTALATIIIAAFTVVLWVATSQQAQLTREAIALTRDDFNATNRPKLRVHFIRRIREDVSRSWDDQPIAAEFRIENIGRGTALVTKSDIALDFFASGDFPHPDELTGSDILGRISLEKGSGQRFIVHNPEIGSRIAFIRTNFAQSLYLIGWIIYEDSIGPQTMYFIRQFSDGGHRAVRVPDSDYDCSADQSAE